MSSNEVEKAKCLLKSFIDERLSGNILNFTEYSLRCLIGDEKYGAPSKEAFSSMKILSAIGVVLQSGTLDEERTTRFSYSAGGGYKPLIINTKASFYKFIGLKNYFDLNSYELPLTVIEKIRHSHHLNWTIGNYIVLPVLSEKNTPTLDWLRRLQNWNTDKLFSVIDNYCRGRESGGYLEKLCLDSSLGMCTLFDNPIMTFEEFVKINCLEEYFDEDGRAETYYDGRELNMLPHNRKHDSEDLLEKIEYYVTVHDDLIQMRTMSLIQALKSILYGDNLEIKVKFDQ